MSDFNLPKTNASVPMPEINPCRSTKDSKLDLDKQKKCGNCIGCVPVDVETLKQINEKLENYEEVLRILNAMATFLQDKDFKSQSEDFRLGFKFALMEINKAMNGDFKRGSNVNVNTIRTII